MSPCFTYIDTCDIKRRQATGRDGGVGTDQYDLYASDESCLFIEKPGRFEKQDSEGRDVIYDGEFRIEQEIYESDIIVMDNIEYIILIVLPIRDRIIDSIIYYRAFIRRRRKITAALQQAEPVIN